MYFAGSGAVLAGGQLSTGTNAYIGGTAGAGVLLPGTDEAAWSLASRASGVVRPSLAARAPLPAGGVPDSIARRMRLQAHTPALAALLLFAAAQTVRAEAPAESEPETEAAAEWGRPNAGLRLSLAADAMPVLGGKFRFRLAIQNTNAAPAPLGPAEGLCGWMLIVQQWGDARQGFYSAKVRLTAPQWPREMAAGETIALAPVDLSDSDAWSLQAARELLSTYLAEDGAPTELPNPAGKLSAVLSPGRAAAKFTLLVPTAGGKPLVLTSGALALVIRPPDLAKIAPEARDAFLADLVAMFDRSAWAASQAHDAALAAGPAVVPALLEAIEKPGHPGYARMWLAATLADLPDPRSIPALIRLLGDRTDRVNQVVAYHGPHQQNADLDAAIVRAAQESGDPQVAALAVLGFLVWRGTAPEALLESAIENEDPRARAAVAQALAGRRGPYPVERLLALLADEDERVRGAAAAVLGRFGDDSPKVVGALVEALQRPGESARRRITRALAELTGHDWPYDPGADQTARDTALRAWQDWWATKRPKRD